jgi:mono/diheme cytochrome c family protein
MMRALLILVIPLMLAGCDEQSMIQQKRYDPYEPSKLWRNGSEAQPLPSGTMAQSDLARDMEVKEPPPVTAALVERGRQRFDIFCSPCHGLSGRGDGMIVQRGFPPPPSYHSARLRSAPARHFFNVITNGFGVMYPYAARVEPHDRWAIVAYIRALQTSQHAQLADVPDAREKLP